MNTYNRLKEIAAIICLMLFVPLAAYSGRPPGQKGGGIVYKVATNDNYKTILINNIMNYYSNNGDGSFNPFSADNEGFEFGKGSSGFVIFEDGVVWGCFENGVKKVGGSTYNHGLQAGRIVTPGNGVTNFGVADNPGLLKYRIFRVRTDINPSTLFNTDMEDRLQNEEVTYISRYEDFSAQQLYDSYIADWNEWPAGDGAPYKDVDANGSYNPTIDIPGVVGADQTLWYVSNDLDPTRTDHLYGSPPIGLEHQKTIWAYRRTGALGNTIFASTKLINKSGARLDSMFIAQWADPDLGGGLGFRDDFVGCDTTRSLGYIYNGQARDGFYGTKVPAGGFVFFQGPIVYTGNSSDSAVFGLKYRYGYKNLKMSAFNFFVNGNATYADPALQDPQGTIQWYCLMNGRIGRTCSPYTNPVTGQLDKFLLSGDPVTGTGWIDGQIAPPDDRRMALIAGPFVMQPGDTQEVVVANLAAIGGDRLSSIAVLKYNTDIAQQAYNLLFDLPVPPVAPRVIVTELNQEILLDWSDPVSFTATEVPESKGYKFEGYNVYQYPSAGADEKDRKLIATFDLKNGLGRIKDYVFDETVNDLVYEPVRFGTDIGVQRYFNIKKDIFERFGTPLVNGQSYYFAVTAYSYNGDIAIQQKPTPSLESSPVIIAVVPHSTDPGVRLDASTQETAPLAHSAGIANATVTYTVIDPTKLTGAAYTVGWHTQPDVFTGQTTSDPSSAPPTIGEATLDARLILNEAGTEVNYTVKLTNVDSLTGPITEAHFHDSSGTAVKLLTFVYTTVLNKQIATATGLWRQVDTPSTFTTDLLRQLIAGYIYADVHTAVNPGGEINTTVSVSTYPWYLDRGATRILPYQQNYSLDNTYAVVDGLQVKVGRLQFAAPVTFFSRRQTVKANPSTNVLRLWGDGFTVFGFGTGLARDFYGAGGGSTTLTDLVQDLEFRFTGVPDPSYTNPLEAPIISGGSIATIRARLSGAAIARVRIPFELWEVENNRQINVTIVDRNSDAGSPWGDTGTPRWWRVRGRDYIVPLATPYDTTTAASAIRTRTDPYTTWIVFFDGGEGGTQSSWDTGDRYLVVYANPIVPGADTYTFQAPNAPSYSNAVAQQDVEKINVFPNPYFGFNKAEINKYNRFITFSHLAPKATIRIFTLSGILVRTIMKDDATTQFAQWDLTNESGIPAAAGMYIAHIDMPLIGKTKTLKFAIIPETQYLDRL